MNYNVQLIKNTCWFQTSVLPKLYNRGIFSPIAHNELHTVTSFISK